MKESKAIQLTASDIDSATPTGTGFRTKDGKSDIDSSDLPIVILDWSTNKFDGTGHTNFNRYTTDTSGNRTGKVKEKYFEMDYTFIIKSELESERDSIADSIQRQFLPYEDNSDSFHRHTMMWDVGEIKPRSLQAVESDWFESFLNVEFKFKKEIEISGDTLTGVNETYNVE